MCSRGPKFSQGASQLLLSLDDTAAVYKEPTDGIWPGNPQSWQQQRSQRSDRSSPAWRHPRSNWHMT